jgi:hypothetical protein
MGARAVDSTGVGDGVESFNPELPERGQFLPRSHGTGEEATVPVMPGEEGTVAVAPTDPAHRLREELQKLAGDVAALDRRDAAQHGGLKGEIAHLVRRIARLEALPKARPTR